MANLEQTWSTGQIQAGKAFSYWKEVICANLLQMQIDSCNQSNFFGEITKYPLGPLKANFISVTEQRVRRTRPFSSGAQDSVFHLIHTRRGVQNIRHYGRELTVEPGSSLLIDCLSSFEFHCPQGSEVLVLEIERDWIRSWLPAPEDAAGQIINGSVGWGATLSSALGNLNPHSMAALELPHSVIAEQIAVLLSLAVAPSGRSLTTHKRALLRRVSEALRERCHEASLDPASLASSLGLSRRYIHMLFASAGTTFTQELYKYRLQRAQRLLCDKRYDGVSIAEVAWNCGFSEPSHFTRRFREQFGTPPTGYRRRVADRLDS
jgi:AraC-like DNA-binding protein